MIPGNHVAAGSDCEGFQWEGPEGHFLIVCDCKPLVDVAMGTCPLTDMSLQPSSRRLTRSLATVIMKGMQPLRSHGDPVLWRKRDCNKIAYHLVNVTMDAQSSWEEVYPPSDFALNLIHANFVMHCDGGTRASQCSAGAWVLEAHVDTEHGVEVIFLGRKGIYMASPISSFTAELIALESCATAFEIFWTTLVRIIVH